MVDPMSIYSNMGSSIYWNNPDSNFGFNNGCRNNSPVACYNNNVPIPISTSYSTVGINNFAGLGAYNGLDGLGYNGLGIGISPFLWNGCIPF